jgi:hypothetical protein
MLYKYRALLFKFIIFPRPVSFSSHGNRVHNSVLGFTQHYQPYFHSYTWIPSLYRLHSLVSEGYLRDSTPMYLVLVGIYETIRW